MTSKVLGTSGLITVVAGTPNSGKTAMAQTIARDYFSERKPVIYFHADGPILLKDTCFDIHSPRCLPYFHYVPELIGYLGDLIDRSKAVLAKGNKCLVVVDALPLFRIDPLETI